MYECCPTEAVEIESAEQLVEHIEAHGSMHNVVVQGVDLRPAAHGDAIRRVPAEDACFLGCLMEQSTEDHIHDTGGTIFPAFTGLPFHPYRSSLYDTTELMDGYRRGEYDSLHDTVDRQIYDYFTERKAAQKSVPVMDALAFRIHDHAIDDALADLIKRPSKNVSGNGELSGELNRRVVGVMGGHQLERDEPAFRKVVHIGWQLARSGFFVATGGGPGAMEAANLGAYLSTRDVSCVDQAVDHLAGAPGYKDDGYFDVAYDVLDAYPDGEESLAIPTWFYGHEPSNLFPSHVAKYFANSIREDGLLAIASHGVIYAPGSAGTIQEVFMDAAQNHYETFGAASPMVFLDRMYWTETKPVYPLVKTLSQETPYDGLISIHDAVDDVTQEIVRHADESRAS